MKFNKLSKVGDSFTVHRYDNGFMMEVTGRDDNDDWKTVKVVCGTLAELNELIAEYNNMELDN